MEQDGLDATMVVSVPPVDMDGLSDPDPVLADQLDSVEDISAVFSEQLESADEASDEIVNLAGSMELSGEADLLDGEPVEPVQPIDDTTEIGADLASMLPMDPFGDDESADQTVNLAVADPVAATADSFDLPSEGSADVVAVDAPGDDLEAAGQAELASPEAAIELMPEAASDDIEILAEDDPEISPDDSLAELGHLEGDQLTEAELNSSDDLDATQVVEDVAVAVDQSELAPAGDELDEANLFESVIAAADVQVAEEQPEAAAVEVVEQEIASADEIEDLFALAGSENDQFEVEGPSDEEIAAEAAAEEQAQVEPAAEAPAKSDLETELELAEPSVEEDENALADQIFAEAAVAEEDPDATEQVAADFDPDQSIVAPVADQPEEGYSQPQVENEPADLLSELSAEAEVEDQPRPNLFPDDHLPAAMELPPVRSSRWLLMRHIGVAMGLLLLISGQLLYLFRVPLKESELVRPWQESLCGVLGCSLPQLRDTGKIGAVAKVVISHPHFRGALRVDLSLQNSAEFAQPFPIIRLMFLDRQEQPLAGRDFDPEDYLTGPLQGKTLMQPMLPEQITLEIKDPGPQAVNYRFSYH